MKQAFIIMQIGNPDLDKVCENTILPALRANDLDPKRVDKHNQGGLLKNEIINFIENADIIIADLTNERPNCYLEIGYAMGVDKIRNLILIAREDHLLESPNHKVGGPKIHFDLAGYDILFWDFNELDKFRDDLTKKIRRRLAILVPSQETELKIWDEEWIKINSERARTGFTHTGISGCIEIRHTLINTNIEMSQKDLLIAAEKAQIHTFGWPMGVVLNNLQDRPRPKADGIVAEISIENPPAFDYWTLRKNGDFYLLQSFFEDSRKDAGKFLFFNTQIVRVTEALLHCARLYANLNIPYTIEVAFAIKYSGLQNRLLTASASNRHLWPSQVSAENSIEIAKQFPLSDIESQLVENVKIYTAPLFSLFGYQEFADSVYEDIVNNYVDGKVT